MEAGAFSCCCFVLTFSGDCDIDGKDDDDDEDEDGDDDCDDCDDDGENCFGAKKGVGVTLARS